MSCRATRRRLAAALDGRLAADERAALDAHLAACPACRAERARWEAAARALRASGPTPLPPGLADRAWRAAVAAPAPRHEVGFVLAARRALLVGAAAAAAAWLAVLAGGGAPAAPSGASAAQDPLEVALALWTGEAGGHGD